MRENYTRKEVVDHLIQLKGNEIEALEQSRTIFSNGADLDEESTLTVDDLAQQSQSSQSALSLQVRIDNAKNNLEHFKTIHSETSKEIGDGSIIFTDKVNFVIGLSFQEFEWGNKKFIGTSIDAPIYSTLEGKVVGDEVEFNDIKYTIEEIL